MCSESRKNIPHARSRRTAFGADGLKTSKIVLQTAPSDCVASITGHVIRTGLCETNITAYIIRTAPCETNITGHAIRTTPCETKSAFSVK